MGERRPGKKRPFPLKRESHPERKRRVSPQADNEECSFIKKRRRSPYHFEEEKGLQSKEEAKRNGLNS